MRDVNRDGDKARTHTSKNNSPKLANARHGGEDEGRRERGSARVCNSRELDLRFDGFELRPGPLESAFLIRHHASSHSPHSRRPATLALKTTTTKLQILKATATVSMAPVRVFFDFSVDGEPLGRLVLFIHHKKKF